MPADADLQDLVYVASRRALVANGWTVTLVDTAGNKPVGLPVALSSSAMGRSGQPLHIVNEMRWTWAGGEPLALVRVWGSVDAPPAGIGVWRPLREPAPGYVAGTNDGRWQCKLAALAPDGSLAAIVGCDHAKPQITDIDVIDTATRQRIATVTVPADAVDAVFSADGKQIAFSTKNHEIGLYDIARKQTHMLAGGEGAEIRSLAMRATEPRLAASTADDQVSVWDTTTGKHQVLKRQGDRVVFSPDGGTLAVGSYGKLALVDTTSWGVTHELTLARDTVIRKLAWSPDSAQLAVLAYNTGLIVFEVRSTAAAAADDSWWSRIKPIPSPAEGPPPPRDGSISGVVTLEGKPVAGLELSLKAEDQAPASVRRAPPPVTRTDKTGAFRFDNVYRERWQCDFAVPGAERSGFGADLREQKTRTLKLALEPAVTLAGRVVDPAGRPVAGARVHHVMYDGTLDLDLVTDTAGSFTRDHMHVEPMSPGVSGPSHGYIIDVDRADGAVGQLELDLSTAGRRDFTIKLVPPTDPRVVKVIVVNTAGQPVPKANVIANERATRVTDARGRVSMLWNERQIEVRAMGAGGFTRQRVNVTLPHAAPITLTLENN